MKKIIPSSVTHKSIFKISYEALIPHVTPNVRGNISQTNTLVIIKIESEYLRRPTPSEQIICYRNDPLNAPKIYAALLTSVVTSVRSAEIKIPSSTHSKLKDPIKQIVVYV